MVHTACGQQHCAAVTSEGIVYTWGNGGYGRLGHRNQADVWSPKALDEIRAREVSRVAPRLPFAAHPQARASGWAVLGSTARLDCVAPCRRSSSSFAGRSHSPPLPLPASGELRRGTHRRDGLACAAPGHRRHGRAWPVHVGPRQERPAERVDVPAVRGRPAWLELVLHGDGRRAQCGARRQLRDHVGLRMPVGRAWLWCVAATHPTPAAEPR